MFGLFKKKKTTNEPTVVCIGDSIARCAELYGEPFSRLDDGALMFRTSSLLPGSSASVTFNEDGLVEGILYAVPPGEGVSKKAALHLMERSIRNPTGKWEGGGHTLFGNESFYHTDGLAAEIDDTSLFIRSE